MKRKVLTVMASIAAVGLVATGCASAGESNGTDAEGGLPSSQVWSGYGVATGVYAELGAVSEMLTSTHGTTVRILTSDTGIGRITPLRDGQADIARLSREAFYAFEGTEEFATQEWGPQDLRTVWTPPSTIAAGTSDGTGIESLEDIAGKRVPWAPGNISAQIGIEGILQYADLTWDDVERVDLDYSSWPEALRNGQIDLISFSISSPGIMEAANQMDYKWLDFDGDAAAEERLAEVDPPTWIQGFTSPVGMDGRDEVRGPTYAIPMTTYADYNAEETYALAKAFDEGFDQYKDATLTTPGWDIETIDWEPRVLPHHDGLVKYLEEQDLWTEDYEERNQQLIERQTTLSNGWDELIEQGLDGDELTAAWDTWREENAPLILPDFN